MQIMLTGFLGKTKAKSFMNDLWILLLEAQQSPYGIPKELVEIKKAELQKKEVSEPEPRTCREFFIYLIHLYSLFKGGREVGEKTQRRSGQGSARKVNFG